MKFLPFENITYKTRLREDEVIKRLEDNLEPARTFRIRMFGNVMSKPYEGQINGRYFNIQRIIGYRNSFLPVIKGTIDKNYDGTVITINMQLHVIVVVFICIWCSVFGFGGISILTQVFANSEFSYSSFIPVGMVLFVYGITMAGFKFESNKSKEFLQELFEAEVIKE